MVFTPLECVGIKELHSVHLNKEKETFTDLVITFSDIVGGDASENNKVSLVDVIINSIPVLLGLLIKIKDNALLFIDGTSVLSTALLSARHCAKYFICTVCSPEPGREFDLSPFQRP